MAVKADSVSVASGRKRDAGIERTDNYRVDYVRHKMGTDRIGGIRGYSDDDGILSAPDSNLCKLSFGGSFGLHTGFRSLRTCRIVL